MLKLTHVIRIVMLIPVVISILVFVSAPVLCTLSNLINSSVTMCRRHSSYMDRTLGLWRLEHLHKNTPKRHVSYGKNTETVRVFIWHGTCENLISWGHYWQKNAHHSNPELTLYLEPIYYSDCKISGSGYPSITPEHDAVFGLLTTIAWSESLAPH